MQKIQEISKKGIRRVDFSCRGGFYARLGGNAVDLVDGVDERMRDYNAASTSFTKDQAF